MDRAAFNRAATMVKLTADDEAQILTLSPSDALDHTQAILAQIAARHSVDWRTWLSWQSSDRWTKLLPWLAKQYRSPAYEAMVGFAFKRAWPMESDAEHIPDVFDAFVDSIHALGLEAAGNDNTVEAAENARRGLAAMFISVGPAAARFAYVAMRRELAGKRQDWLDHAWGVAAGQSENIVIGDAMVTTNAVSERSDSI